jgi:hypothetical protein
MIFYDLNQDRDRYSEQQGIDHEQALAASEAARRKSLRLGDSEASKHAREAYKHVKAKRYGDAIMSHRSAAARHEKIGDQILSDYVSYNPRLHPNDTQGKRGKGHIEAYLAHRNARAILSGVGPI